MASDDSSVSFEQMKGAIGSLLFLWSQIEKELAESLDALQNDVSSKPAHGIARRVELWSSQMQTRTKQDDLATRLSEVLVSLLREALVVRNLVCHGLIGIYAKPYSEGKDAYLSVELDDTRRDLSWTELHTMFEWMSRARWLIRDLTAATLETDNKHAANLLLGWQKFPHQR